MNYCPNCGNSVSDDAKFCNACGAVINQSATNQKITDTAPKNGNNVLKDVYSSATASLNKYTGEEGSVNVNLKSMFSEVFKHHTVDEAEDIFIVGTKKTTPTLDEISDDWAKPWLFSRIFVGFLIAFSALLAMAVNFNNENAIPGLILVGAFAVPASGLVFFFEANAFKNISFFQIMKIFFIGGVFSLIVTVFLYQFVTFSIQSQVFGTMTIKDALSVGLVEELGKLVIVSFFISQLNVKRVLDGLLVGASVGAGFAAFETAGYIYRAGSNLLDVAILRGWSALGGHLVWAAIIGGAIVIVKREQPFEFGQLLDTRFLVFFFIAVILHAVWDWDVTLLGSSYLKIIALIVIAWVIVFVLMSAGLKEVSRLKANQSKS